MGRLSAANYLWRKIFPRLPRSSRIVLHLGCGANYIDRAGYINVDGNIFRKKDLWLDITLGLPFPRESIDVVFASHLLEHLNEKEVRRLLNESYRVLKPGGAVRFVTPHLGKAIEAYVTGKGGFFTDWPDHRKSIGGKFNNHLLCRDQHSLMFDFGFINELLIASGFSNCRELGPLESELFTQSELNEIQWEDAGNHRSLFVEAVKIGK